MILLKEWNFYFKNIYESANAMNTILYVLRHDDVFSMEDIEFRVSVWQMGNIRTLKATKMKSLKSNGISSSPTCTSSSI
jgi:hypothetical protein